MNLRKVFVLLIYCNIILTLFELAIEKQGTLRSMSQTFDQQLLRNPDTQQSVNDD